MIKKLFNWIFKAELNKLDAQIIRAKNIADNLDERLKVFDKVLSGIDVSVDVHEYNYSPSWAVISIQGQKTDYIKFINLGNSDIKEISRFLRNFEYNSNIKIDASPNASRYLRIARSEKF